MKTFLYSFIGLFIFYALIFESVGQTNLDSGLVAYFSFDDSTATDLVAGQHSANIFGGPDFVQGVSGTGISMDGVDDYLEVPAGLNIMEDYTVTFWIKPYSDGTLFSKGESCPNAAPIYKGTAYSASFGKAYTGCYSSIDTSQGHLNISAIGPTGNFDDDRIRISTDSSVRDSSDFIFASIRYSNTTKNFSLQLGNWKIDSTELMTYYENGSSSNCDTILPADFPGVHQTTSSLTIGAVKSYCNNATLSMGSFIRAEIDEIRFYQRSLSDDEIAILLNNIVNSVDEAVESPRIHIFPNPSSGSFKIESPEVRIQAIQIFDLNGREINSSISLALFQAEVTTTFSGMAIIRVRHAKGYTNHKVLLN